MEGRKPLFFDEEAAVDDLVKGHFWDKALIDKALFEIGKAEQNGQKWAKRAEKSDGKKNFHFGNFPLSNRQKLGILRKKDR